MVVGIGVFGCLVVLVEFVMYVWFWMYRCWFLLNSLLVSLFCLLTALIDCLIDCFALWLCWICWFCTSDCVLCYDGLPGRFG